MLGRNSSWQGWQFRQAVDAIELLLREMVSVSWVDSFDWQQWYASAKELSDQHPTIARESVSSASRMDKDRSTKQQSQHVQHASTIAGEDAS